MPTPSPPRPQVSHSVSRSVSAAASQTSLQPPERPSTPRSQNTRPAAPYPPGSPFSNRQSRQLLRQLRESFQKTKDSLRREALETTASPLNDVRRKFRSTARGTFKRLTAWQKKHASGIPNDVHIAGDAASTEPEWWNGTCHVVPGGGVVVREGEWGSVIAFTLR